MRTQTELLNSLLRGGDTLMLELTKLKVANGQLEDALKEINEATHRYLFWTSDVSPIGFSWPLEIVQDLRRLISLDTMSQLGKASMMMLTSKETLLPLFVALILVGFSISSRRHFTSFLERSSARVGKVTQDHFWLTLRTVFWSILVASPLPVLWMTLGYGLQAAWPFPLAVAIGDSVTATVPLLWVVMICATFARPNGLFVAHFGWPRSRVSKAMRYYLMSIGLIVPLIMALITFDNLNDREFSASLGRLCFMLICGALAMVTLSLKRAGIPLYLDKEGSGDNMLNRLLWNMLLGAPLVADPAAPPGVRSRQAPTGGDPRPARTWRRRGSAYQQPGRFNGSRGQRGRSGCHQYPVVASGALPADADRAGVGYRAVVRNPFRVWLPGEYLAVGRHLYGTGR